MKNVYWNVYICSTRHVHERSVVHERGIEGRERIVFDRSESPDITFQQAAVRTGRVGKIACGQAIDGPG
jgi:hypothetical protein